MRASRGAAVARSRSSWTRRRSTSSIEVSREAVSTRASSAGCIPREGPLTSTTPRVRPDQGSRSGAAAQPQRVCDSTKCSGPWMCTPSPSTRLVPIALVPTLPSVQAEPPTKPRPSAIRRTPVEPARQSTRPSTSATTTSWPASITEARVWVSRGTNSPSALSARRRSSSPASRGGTSGADPGSRPPAETRRHDAAMVVLGAEAELGTGQHGLAPAVQLLLAVHGRSFPNTRRMQRPATLFARSAHGCVLDHISLGEGGTMTQAPERETSAAPAQRGATPDPQARTDAWLAKFESALEGPRRRGGRGPVRDRELLARPGRVHLEPQDGRGPRRRHRPARRRPSTPPTPAASRPRSRPTRPTAWSPRGSASRPPSGEAAACSGLKEEDGEDRGVDPAHHDVRAQGLRGAARHPPAHGRRARRQQGADDLEGEAPARGRDHRQHHPALRAGGRRRPGRHRPRRAAAPARRTQPRHRQAPATRRPVAQPLQVAVPARPGLVRPPALPEVPRQLAGVRAQGQDRRLAGVLHPGDGGALLVEYDGHQRAPGPKTRGSGPSRSSARASR